MNIAILSILLPRVTILKKYRIVTIYRDTAQPYVLAVLQLAIFLTVLVGPLPTFLLAVLLTVLVGCSSRHSHQSHVIKNYCQCLFSGSLFLIGALIGTLIGIGTLVNWNLIGTLVNWNLIGTLVWSNSIKCEL